MSPIPPILCGTLLAAMMAAGLSHHWSIQGFLANYEAVPVRLSPAVSPMAPAQQQKMSPEPPLELATLTASTSPGPGDIETAAEKEFFKGLVAEMKQLRNENRDLLDQLSETNREVMKLEFRVDTHSESFRPLPTSEERLDTTFGIDHEEDIPGVLPPRANPVYPLEE